MGKLKGGQRLWLRFIVGIGTTGISSQKASTYDNMKEKISIKEGDVGVQSRRTERGNVCEVEQGGGVEAAVDTTTGTRTKARKKSEGARRRRRGD